MEPKISVIIPTFNRSKTLVRAINSVLNQTYKDIEIIVVDDASTDNTFQVIESFVRSGKVRYIKHKARQGAQAARITGIINSTGEYIAFLDSDDELLPNSLEVRLEALYSSGFDSALIYGDVLLDNGKVIQFKRLYGNVYKYLLKELSLCPYSVMMIPKRCFDITGFPDPQFPSWQDDDMVLTIGKFFPVIHCGHVVAKMHTSTDSITKNKRKLYIGCKMMVEKYKNDIIKYHGRKRLLLWYLRIFRSWLISRYAEMEEKTSNTNLFLKYFYKTYSIILRISSAILTRFLRLFFDNIYG